MRPYAEECQGLLVTPEAGRGRKNSSLEPSEGTQLCHLHLVWPPELGENKFLLL